MLDQALIVKLCIVQHNKDTNNTSLALQSSWESPQSPPAQQGIVWWFLRLEIRAAVAMALTEAQANEL